IGDWSVTGVQTCALPILSNEYRTATQRDTAASDQSRAAQQDIVQRQLGLLDQILGFDPEAEAQRQTDRALSASLAQARSARGGRSEERRVGKERRRRAGR